MKNITEITENFAHYMFYRVKKLIKADFNVGNATSVGADGFNSCFISCSNLTTTPNFSNITSGVGSQGFEPSQYLKEKKVKTIAIVAASELAGA